MISQSIPGSLSVIYARLLQQIRRDVAGSLMPELQTPYARYTATTTVSILDHMIRWLDSGGDAVTDVERRALLDALGGAQPFEADGRLADFEDSAQLGFALEAAVARSGGGATQRLATIERSMLERESAALTYAQCADEAALEELEIEVTTDRLDRYFAATDLFRDRKALAVSRIPGGYSKDTFLVTTQGGSESEELVIRRDFPFGPTEASAADEFEVMRKISEAGLPAPTPLAAERDQAWLGQAFLVMEKMPGKNAAPLFAEDPALARSGSLQLASLLGRLHALDPAKTGFLERPVDAPAQQVRAHIAGWRAHWLRHRIHPAPLADAAFAWLDQNVPQDIPHLVLVHADARPDNLLMENGRISAWLDWEFTHVGDPAEDLEYTRLFVEPHVDWSEFEQAYLAAGGVQVSASGSRFYEVWRSLRNFVCCDVSWAGFVTGQYPVIKLSAQGIIHRRYFLRTIAETLERLG